MRIKHHLSRLAILSDEAEAAGGDWPGPADPVEETQSDRHGHHQVTRHIKVHFGERGRHDLGG